MIENLPLSVSVLFGLTTLATLFLFYQVLRKSPTDRAGVPRILLGLIVWLAGQALLTLNNFYNTDTTALPPKFLLIIIPPLLTIALLFSTKRGRYFIDSLPLINLTYLNVVRVPVEVVLYWLFLYGAVPERMTFEGRNLDILAGITAPLVAYFGLQQKKMGSTSILLWNVVSLGLLLNIVVNGVLSAPLAFQKFAFDQPNVALLYFPFSWLPAYIVPTVLFGHLVSIRQLVSRKNQKKVIL
jgi:hypothetical protein